MTTLKKKTQYSETLFCQSLNIIHETTLLMIEVRDLSKWFPTPGGPKTAVDAIQFTVHPGEVFGLLGPNGAGKTTTLRMLSTVFTPTGRTAPVAGFHVVSDPSPV